MRVVVTGGSGNVGTSVISALGEEGAVDSILGIARRKPSWSPPKTQWAVADVSKDDLDPLLAGADVVIHLAWAIQPSRSIDQLAQTNLIGSERVFNAAIATGVRQIVHGSSMGAYSPAADIAKFVDEYWPTGGIPSSWYSQHKAQVESMLDSIERENPKVRVARVRPALIFKHDAASEIARYFIGPFLPPGLLRPGVLPVVPGVKGLVFQAVHSVDVGDAYRRVVASEATGPFNIAADPPIDSATIAHVLGGRSVPLPSGLVRSAAAVAWRLRLQPTSPDWLDLALRSPLVSSDRATDELGWKPVHGATETLIELFDGIRSGAGTQTPPLEPRSRKWLSELRSGVGASNP